MRPQVGDVNDAIPVGKLVYHPRRLFSFLEQPRSLYVCKARTRFEDILCADGRKVVAIICSIAVPIPIVDQQLAFDRTVGNSYLGISSGLPVIGPQRHPGHLV
jgi:hypothetical protein